jgi:hypothetical protein
MNIQRLFFLGVIFTINLISTHTIQARLSRRTAILARICSNSRALAVLNNTEPKLTFTIPGGLMPASGCLGLLLMKELSDDPDLLEFDNLVEQFNNRPNPKPLSTPQEFFANKRNLIAKYFGDGQNECETFIEEMKQLDKMYFDQLEPEHKEVFNKCSILLDKIYDKYPSQINEWKKTYEEDSQRSQQKLQ